MFRRLLVERSNLVSPEGQRHFQSVGAGTPQEALRSRDLVKRSIGSQSEWRQPRKIRDCFCQQTTSFERTWNGVAAQLVHMGFATCFTAQCHSTNCDGHAGRVGRLQICPPRLLGVAVDAVPRGWIRRSGSKRVRCFRRERQKDRDRVSAHRTISRVIQV